MSPTRWPLPQHALHPSHYLMTGRIRGFVEIDHSRTNVLLKVALEGCTTAGNRGEMPSSNKHYLASADVALVSYERGKDDLRLS